MLQRLMVFKNLEGWWSEGFCSINFGEYSKSTKEKLYSNLSEEQNIWKVAESLYRFLSTPDEVEKYVEIMQSILLTNIYIAITLKFWIFLIQNYNWFSLKL